MVFCFDKEEALKYESMTPFVQDLIKNPKNGAETIKGLQDLVEIFSQAK